MKDILGKYKERLINLSSRNRSLALKKIYKRRTFDLNRLNDISAETSDQIIEFLFKREKENLLLLDDPYETKIGEIRELDKGIEITRQESFCQLKTLDTATAKEKMQSINEKLEKKREVELEKIEKKEKKLIDYSVSLKYLQREIIAMEKETGLYELFVGYPFAEGKFKDGTFVNAPLLLFPVRIANNNNQWFIENIVEQEVLINKVFVLGYVKYNEAKIDEFDMEFSSLDDFGEAVVDGLIAYLAKWKIKVQDTQKREIEKFVDRTNQNLPSYTDGEIVMKNYLVLGQFPISNSIYNDYVTLGNMKIDNPLLDKLLINDAKSDAAMDSEDEDDEKLTFSERDVFFISHLDYSQENAVNKVNDTNQLVVYGPPGTGKSQTIANIIADALAKGKKVLMVSQKRAALDVIYNRLADIQSKLILLHDANKDKKDFYQKVSDILENTADSINKCDKDTILQRANKIDEQIKCLEKIAVALHKPREFGLTLQQMYSKTKAINSKSDHRYEEYKALKAQNCVCDNKYKELAEAVNKIIDEAVLSDFRQYKTMVLENPALQKLEDNIDFLQSEELIGHMDDIVSSCKGIHGEITDIRNKDLVESYRNNEKDIETEELEKIAQKLNHIENSQLLEPINTGRWWSVKYWLDYKKNKLMEQENRCEYEKKHQEKAKEIEALNERMQAALKWIEILKTVMDNHSYNELRKNFLNGSDLQVELQNVVQALKDYDAYKLLAYKVGNLSELEARLLEYGYSRSSGIADFKERLAELIGLTILAHISEIEKLPGEQEALRHYTCFNDVTKVTNSLMLEKNKLVPNFIISLWDNRLSKHNESKLYREFKRQANKKRMLWPIRKYIDEFSGVVLDTLPCWLLSPETVSDILPMSKGMFDMVIFDEASQMFVENAIPTVYRGKQVVVAGDDKQLKPNSSFKAKLEEIDEGETTLENSAALEEESLLDLAKVNFDSVYLNYHYRSRFDELINFSNYAFYGGRLQVSPNIINTSLGTAPIQRVKVAGKWLERKNIAEAEKVVEMIAEIFKLRTHNETIGVITFNIAQKDLIEDLLERRANNDSEFKSYYVNEIDRKDGNEDISLFVKNIENVQGDERDIIVFSIGYAPDEKGRVSVNFGSLSQDGGENRLNVAISRAKKRVYVITSIEPEQLSVDGTKNNGPKLFKKYLQYAREVSNGNCEEAKAILNSLVDSSIDRNMNQKYDSDFELEVYDALVEKGYKVDTQVGVSGYKIDLAIYNEDKSRYILGIECDGVAYHSSKSARERDIHRQRYLESRGWRIARIWSRDWWKNPGSEINKIESLIQEAFPNFQEPFPNFLQ